MSQNRTTDTTSRDRPPGSPGDDQPTASELSERTATRYCVLGGGRLGDAIAEQLRQAGATITRIDEHVDGPECIRADPTDAGALEAAGVDEATMAIVATPSDSRNLLLAQRLRTRFGVERAVVLANDPESQDLIADAGHDPVCVTTALATTLAEEA